MSHDPQQSRADNQAAALAALCFNRHRAATPFELPGAADLTWINPGGSLFIRLAKFQDVLDDIVAVDVPGQLVHALEDLHHEALLEGLLVAVLQNALHDAAAVRVLAQGHHLPAQRRDGPGLLAAQQFLWGGAAGSGTADSHNRPGARTAWP